MGMTPEAKVKKQVKKILDEYGVWHFSPPGMGLGRAGIPDIIACHGGQFLAIECKAGSNKPTLLQERELERITQAGGHALVIREDNINELHRLLLWTKKN